MTSLITHFAAASCSHFLGFPTWYEYIRAGGSCSELKIDNISDIWLIVAAIIEILLRVAAIVAIGFVIYAGFQYITSKAEPEAVNKARISLINALVGLAIAILASVTVNFIAGSIN